MSTAHLEVPRGDRSLVAHVTSPDLPGPAVVCETGLGDNHHGWDRVVDLLAPVATVITYDRAGYGGSAAAGDGRHLRSLAADLVAVCDELAPERPVVLAGHSLGGRIARAATATLVQSHVAGIVVVEGAPDGFLETAPRVARAQALSLRTMRGLGKAGVFRTRMARRRLALAAHIGPRSTEFETMLADVNNRDFWDTVVREWESMGDPMPAIPVVPAVAVIGDGWNNWSRSQRARFGAGPSDLLGAIRADFERHYPSGRVVCVPNTGHHIPRDQPQAVADAIGSLIGIGSSS